MGTPWTKPERFKSAGEKMALSDMTFLLNKAHLHRKDLKSTSLEKIERFLPFSFRLRGKINTSEMKPLNGTLRNEKILLHKVSGA